MSLIRSIAKKVFSEAGSSLSYKIGTMIEIPRAALVADEVRKPFLPYVPGLTDTMQCSHSLLCSFTFVVFTVLKDRSDEHKC